MDHAFIADAILTGAAVCYAAATAGFALHLSHRGGLSTAARTAHGALMAAIALHAAHLVYYSVAARMCPMRTINLGVSLGALGAAAVYVAVRQRLRVSGLGVFVAPIALTCLLAGRFVSPQSVPLEVRARLLPLHILVNVLGDGFLLLAAGAAALYLIQAHKLKAKRGAAVFGRLPPLDSLDRAQHVFLVSGFLLMTVGVVTGTLWLSHLNKGSPVEILRVLLGYLTWLVFSGVLLLRSTLGWRGKRAAWGTLAGLVGAMIVVLLYLSGAGVGVQ